MPPPATAHYTPLGDPSTTPSASSSSLFWHFQRSTTNIRRWLRHQWRSLAASSAASSPGSPRMRVLLIVSTIMTTVFVIVVLSRSGGEGLTEKAQVVLSAAPGPPAEVGSIVSYSPTTTPLHRADADSLARFRPSKGSGDVTAVLLNWTRKDNLRLIVESFCGLPMFRQVIVWNNNVDVHLTPDFFADIPAQDCPPVRVINSPENMYFVARYMACAESDTPYCYFQDDDWVVQNLRSMYSHFLRFPQLIHTDTNAWVYSLTNWQWCFSDAGVDLHACFSWVGTGAFATRSHVQGFLDQLSRISDLDRLEFAYADMYFTTFANQIPYQLQNRLVELPAKDGFSDGSGRERNKLYMHKAAKRIHEALSREKKKRGGRTGPAFERKVLEPAPRNRDVRSPCASDRCLFLANVHPFPPTDTLKYRPRIGITELEEAHEAYHSNLFFVAHPFSHAVDDDARATAWVSEEAAKRGQYFGLDVLVTLPVRVEVVMVVGMPYGFFDKAKIEWSGEDGKVWQPATPAPTLTTVEVREPTTGSVVYVFTEDFSESTKPVMRGSDVPVVKRTPSLRRVPMIECRFVMPAVLVNKWRFVRVVLDADNVWYPFRVYDMSFHEA